MDNKNLFIIAIVAVVAIVGIVTIINNAGTTRSVSEDLVGQAIRPGITDTTACVDTDGGLNYYVKGSTYTSGERKNDSCNNGIGPTLTEYYCRSNKVTAKEWTCPNGCSNGACLNQTVQTCIDSDGGLNYTVFGIVTYTNGSYTGYINDTCNAPNILYERYCIGNLPSTNAWSCSCSGGKCVNPPVQYGNLEVVSTPSGANVYVDYYPKGMTPLIVYNLTNGTHLVVVNKTGYNGYSKYIAIIAGQTTFLNVTLVQNQTQTCTDSDGLNYYVYGNVTWTNGTYSNTIFDYCGSSMWLNEQVCVGMLPYTNGTQCQYGCDGGKCVMNQSDLFAEDIIITIAYGNNSIYTNDTFNYVYGYANVFLRSKVKNTGSYPINAYNFRNGLIIASGNDTSGSYIRCSNTTYYIQPGASFICNPDYFVHEVIPGQLPYTINMIADYYNDIPETNENNNYRTEMLYVFP